MLEFLLDPPFWAWIALAGILLTLEVMTGTFVLLWPAAGAGLTGLATMAPMTPSGPAEWLLFAVLTLVLTLAARALGLKSSAAPQDGRAFNSPASRKGQTAVALTAFEGGVGRVRLGDTDWSARLTEEGTAAPGERLEVAGSDGNQLLVTRKT
ncbi:NfeD family protein [Parvularcula maris]|uniref:NfeD family protein n=1 Tax=Parvularcula maris TaxID=2965077 RepID=A0A9X2RIF2_9PROT|nr:NfeD family protein [Parvularcula maris]MCQ8184891.1 NfeD family protein [Parvularcula maris]